jgi:hypothetical protein
VDVKQQLTTLLDHGGMSLGRAVNCEGFTGLQLEFTCDVIWSVYTQEDIAPW